MKLPGVPDSILSGGRQDEREHWIPHRRILDDLQVRLADGSRGLVEIYRTEVLPAKTRTIRLPGRKGAAEIIHTLLGYEVRASLKRIQCPDLVTARYLKLFSEIGCRSIRLPYDPTLTRRIIPEMEAAVERLKVGVQSLFRGKRDLQLYVMRQLYRHIRRQVHSA